MKKILISVFSFILGIVITGLIIKSSNYWSEFGVVTQGEVQPKDLWQDFGVMNHKDRKGRTVSYYHNVKIADGTLITMYMKDEHPTGENIIFVYDPKDNSTIESHSTNFYSLMFVHYLYETIIGLGLLFFGFFFSYYYIVGRNPRLVNTLGTIKLSKIKNQIIENLQFLQIIFNRIKHLLINTESKLNKINRKLNSNQRFIIAFAILFLLLILCIVIAIKVDANYNDSAFDFKHTWGVWLIFLVLVTIIEFYLFSDDSSKK